MKIKRIRQTTAKKLVNGTLPDIDTDFTKASRSGTKVYMEERFGKSQVCSVGTLDTLQLRGLIKDIARILLINYDDTNNATKLIENEDKTIIDLVKRAAKEPKLKHFLQDNSDLFNLLTVLLGQIRNKSMHACAVIVFPEVMSASEWCPTRLHKGLIVSEWGGEEMDNAGFLKLDVLGLKQLDKFQDIIDLIEKNGKEAPDIYNLPHDREVYRYFSNGWNSDVFQLGSDGLKKYTKSMKPSCLEDLIITNAIYRPGPMNNGYHEQYVKRKHGKEKPDYLWGTEQITKNTYGLLVFQEQIMAVCQQLGGLSLKEADDVRRAMGKKKMNVLLEWESVVKKGFIERGATEKDFEKIWHAMIEFAKYCFNRSHSACYAQMGYISQYFKVNFPIEFWTVSLKWAEEKEYIPYITEILQTKAVNVSDVNINNSEAGMVADQKRNTVFWGIESVKGIGENTALQIIKEREVRGKYTSFADFLCRHDYRGSAVKKTAIEALIASGAFDKLYDYKGKEEKRGQLIKRYRKYKKIRVSNPARDQYTIGKLYERWWWLRQQKLLTGLSFIDYKTLAEESGILTQFCSNMEFSQPQKFEQFRTFGGFLIDVRTGKSKKGKYARLIVENNYRTLTVLVWAEQYKVFSEILKGKKNTFILFSGNIKYDATYSKSNQFTLNERSELIVL